MVMPGVQDPHLHAVEAGINEQLCVLPAQATLAQYSQQIQACAAQQPGTGWVLASGVAMEPLLNQPTNPIDTLDAAVPNRPVLIQDNLGHGAWANTLALQAVGYHTLVGNPPGGVIHRDPNTGRLTGVVFENAQQKLRTAASPQTPANLDFAYQSLLNSLRTLAMNGVTSVSDAGGYWDRGDHLAWIRAETQGTLTVRASNALYVFPDKPMAQQITDLTALYTNDPNRLLRFNQVKIYVDGILDQGTSALNAPYNQNIGLSDTFPTGFLYFTPTELNQYSQVLEQVGFQLHFHATGDRGTKLALDAIQNAAAQNGTTNRRNRITHLFLVDNVDRPRFNSLGVVADFQYQSDAITTSYREFLRTYIGNRADTLLPGASMLNAGAKITLSSDWDANELSPFKRIQRVVRRPVEPLPDVATAIRMMTLDGAFLLHQENKTGSLEVGKFADFIVLDKNILQIPTNEIGTTRVLLTVLGGNTVYDAVTPPGATVKFSAGAYSVNEGDGSAAITVTRAGDTSAPASVEYTTLDGTAAQNRKYTAAAGALNFAAGETSKSFTVLITDNAYVEGNQTVNLSLRNPTGAVVVAAPSTAVLTIVDNDTVTPTANPADEAQFFVRQHYYDFLNRLPDAGGLAYWSGQITQCGNNQTCVNGKRIDVSNAFFYEQEYQQTGAFVFRLYRAAFGNNQPFPNPDSSNQIEAKKLPNYAAFTGDRARVIGGTSLAQGQSDLAQLFVQRPLFLLKYPATLDGPGFVDALLATMQNDLGVDLTAQRAALLTQFNLGGRGAVLYRLADDNEQANPVNNRAFINAEYNRAFVATQYFGYLRRDSDIGGFLFWLGHVNRFPVRDINGQHAMVCAFVTSAEYQQRFSSVVTHTNQECPR